MLPHSYSSNGCGMHLWQCYFSTSPGANSTCVTHQLHGACSQKSGVGPSRLPTSPWWHLGCNTSFAHTLELWGIFTKWGFYPCLSCNQHQCHRNYQTDYSSCPCLHRKRHQHQSLQFLTCCQHISPIYMPKDPMSSPNTHNMASMNNVQHPNII